MLSSSSRMRVRAFLHLADSPQPTCPIPDSTAMANTTCRVGIASFIHRALDRRRVRGTSCSPTPLHAQSYTSANCIEALTAVSPCTSDAPANWVAELTLYDIRCHRLGVDAEVHLAIRLPTDLSVAILSTASV